MYDLIIVETPYQLFNAINFAYHNKESDMDLIIINHFKNAEMLYEKVQSSQIFLRTFLFARDEPRFMARGLKRKLLNARNSIFYRKALSKVSGKSNLIEFENKYDRIFTSVLNEIEVALLRINHKAKLVLYDDGLGSYKGNNLFDTRRKLELMFYRIINGGPYVRTPSSLFVNNVSACKSTTVDKSMIFSLPKFDQEFLTIAKNIFSISNENHYLDKKIIWFSQPIGGLPGEIEHRNIIRNILFDYKDKVIVKIHPRDMDRSFYKDFCIDDESDLWELKLNSINIEEKILIGFCSTAQVTPKYLFNYEPVCIFLYNLNNQNPFQIYKEIIDDVKTQYNKKEKIIIPKNADDFKRIMDNEISLSE